MKYIWYSPKKVNILYLLLLLCVRLSVFGNVTAIDVNYLTDEPEVWPKCCLLREQKNNPFSNIIAHSLKPHPRKMPHATRKISSACSDVYDAFTSA